MAELEARRSVRALAGTVGVKAPAHDGLIHIDIAVPDFQVETTIRIGAHPRFVVNTCPLTAEIRERDQVTDLAFLTLGERQLVQDSHLPTITEFSHVVYTKLFPLTRALKIIGLRETCEIPRLKP
jgi:hypothetical protein